MMLTLSTNNKLGFIDGFIHVPAPNAVEYKFWERCNDLVISWLLLNLEESIVKSVLFMRTAREIWLDLEERFGYASIAQVYSLEQQLAEITQGQDSVSEFFTKIKTLWDGVNDVSHLSHCTCNACTYNLTQRLQQKQQEHGVLQFMMKLSDTFAAVRGNVLMMQHLPNIAQTYRLFAQEERHKELSNITSQTEAMAFVADRRRFPNQSQDQRNYFKSNVSATQNRFNNSGVNAKRGTKPNYFCTHCKISGHSVERCFKIHGYPPGFQARQDKKFAALSQSSQNDF
ncbi:uncharacterized protein LOC141671658 [Apium graveolens]|uniref:uncharacterized protein LOC141671658 n=1 Tax=Apium graveolens TaxID=4045 RepID=UPI003D799366